MNELTLLIWEWVWYLGSGFIVMGDNSLWRVSLAPFYLSFIHMFCVLWHRCCPAVLDYLSYRTINQINFYSLWITKSREYSFSNRNELWHWATCEINTKFVIKIQINQTNGLSTIPIKAVEYLKIFRKGLIWAQTHKKDFLNCIIINKVIISNKNWGQNFMYLLH